MSYTLILEGMASGKTYQYPVTENDLPQTLMDFLVTKNVPVASSCGGRGICKKCQILHQEACFLSCSILLKELFRETKIVYISLSYY
ncbi:MAG: hypothetical protein KBD63_02755 [Bacteriovoracaceae bacterium]|nr:hypothetical protein [Bacteriovoracaceae bacterium]